MPDSDLRTWTLTVNVTLRASTSGDAIELVRDILSRAGIFHKIFVIALHDSEGKVTVDPERTR